MHCQVLYVTLDQASGVAGSDLRYGSKFATPLFLLLAPTTHGASYLSRYCFSPFSSLCPEVNMQSQILLCNNQQTLSKTQPRQLPLALDEAYNSFHRQYCLVEFRPFPWPCGTWAMRFWVTTLAVLTDVWELTSSSKSTTTFIRLPAYCWPPYFSWHFCAGSLRCSFGFSLGDCSPSGSASTDFLVYLYIHA